MVIWVISHNIGREMKQSHRVEEHAYKAGQSCAFKENRDSPYFWGASPFFYHLLMLWVFAARG
jgi:hypothetical protein